MRIDPGNFSVSDLRQRFDTVAATFDGADYVHRSTFDSLLERLVPVTIEAGLVVDLGSAQGRGSAALARTFPKSRVLGVDVSAQMLRRSVKKRRLFSRVREVQADALRLPLQDNGANLVFSNMLLPWVDDLGACFAEANRILKKDAVFAFATLGPDSLAQFRHAASGIDNAPEVYRFPDMHDVGDELVRAGFQDPVLDVDRLIITWASFDQLLDDLTACGALGGAQPNEARRRFQALEDGFPERDASGRFVVELELVFGHAWGSGPRAPAGEFRVEPGSIGRLSRS